jgi:hypothetical protein
LGVREACSGSRRRSLEVFASPSTRNVFDPANRMVVNQLSLRLLRQQPEQADVGVGHDRAPGSGIGTEMATASGSSVARSSGPRRRKPKVLSRLVICSGCLPHSGQATM